MSINLPHYLAESFPGLILNGGLLYRWPIGLRFDLGGRAVTEDEVDLVVHRAMSLFEAVFSRGDQCMVVAQDWLAPEGAHRFAHLSSLFEFSANESVGLDRPNEQAIMQDAEEPENGTHTLTWVNQLARGFRYELIFEGIANADHARAPAISSRVYFANVRTDVIVQMYDDRGMDVIAARKDSLENMYHVSNPWILDYDRTRIDQIFAPNSTRQGADRA